VGVRQGVERLYDWLREFRATGSARQAGEIAQSGINAAAVAALQGIQVVE
jgi:hypothetical protein